MQTQQIQKLNDEYQITLPSYELGNYKKICPKCSHTRKKKHDECLSVTVEIDHVKFNCHHCSWNGGFNFNTARQAYLSKVADEKRHYEQKTKQYPSWETPPNLQISDKHKNYLNKRGISDNTIAAFNLFTKKDNLCFPYYCDGKIVNCKTRTDEKRFYQIKDARKTLYNIDSVSKDCDKLIIVEGEIDVLSLYEVGFTQVVSLPDGAPKEPRFEENDKRFTAFEEHDNIFDIKEIIIATDNDKPGNALKQELVHRFGQERCKVVEFPIYNDKQCKDANEVLQHSKDALIKCIQQAKEFPVAGLHGANEYRDTVQNIYDGNIQRPFSTGFENLDKIYKIMPSTFNLITGMPNHGKSNFLDQILMNLAETYNWKFAIFSPEHSTPNHLRRLSEKRTRKPFDIGIHERMSQTELNGAIDFLDHHFTFIECDTEVPTIDYILEKARIAKIRYGIKGLVIDPYNQISSERTGNAQKREDEHIRDVIAVSQQFARNHQVVVWMVAHPHKLQRNDAGVFPPPDLYQVSGSAHWANMADVGVVVHRDFDVNKTRVITRKIREQGVYGEIGDAYFNFNLRKRVYEESDED